MKEYAAAGKDTMVLVAALKFRFNHCEKRSFSFKKLLKKSENKHSHRVLTKEELAELDL